MKWNILFLVNSILLGIGLAMDAFSVSMANGMHDPKIKKRNMILIAGVFAGFQFAMPMIGWICVHTIVQYFQTFEKGIPWIALILLSYIGGSMLMEGTGGKNAEEEKPGLSIGALLVQGVATSIDALSVGFTIAGYGFLMALAACVIIAAVTFFLCIVGLLIGKKFGTKLSNQAQIFGGVLLIAIGIEIFIKGIF